MEKLILKTCQTRKEISDEALTEILTTSKISYTAEKKAKAINKLLKTGQLMVTNPGDTIMYTYNDDQAAKQLQDLKAQEQLVLQLVRNSGTNGVSNKDIRQQTNMSIQHINASLKDLMQAGMVQCQKSVNQKGIKLYFGKDVTPNSEVTGGMLWAEGNFDHQTRDNLLSRSVHYLRSNTANIQTLTVHLKKVVTDIDEETVEKVLENLSASNDIEDVGSGMYKAVTWQSHDPPTIPCLACPLASSCRVNGKVNPVKWEYLKEWLNSKQLQFQMASEYLMLIDWINTIDEPSWLLVNDIDDLRDGSVLCDIVSHQRGQAPFPDILRQSGKGTNLAQIAQHNFNLLLRHIQIPGITVGQLWESDDAIWSLLKQLANKKEPKPQILLKPVQRQANRTPSPRFLSPRDESEVGLPIQIREHLKKMNAKLQPPAAADLPKAQVQQMQATATAYDQHRRTPSPSIMKRVGQPSTQKSVTISPNKPASPYISGSPTRRYIASPNPPMTVTTTSPTRRYIASPNPEIVATSPTRRTMRSARRTPTASPARYSTLRRTSSKHSLEPDRSVDLSCGRHYTPVAKNRTVDTTTNRDINNSTKDRVIFWLEEIDMVKKGHLNHDNTPGFFQLGIGLCDLINRLSGKSDTIHGIQRAPKNQAAALGNIKKALIHLQSFPKMKSRFLWSFQEVLDGEHDIIWGLLDDLWYFYNKSSSSYNPKNKPKSPGMRSSAKKSAYAAPHNKALPYKVKSMSSTHKSSFADESDATWLEQKSKTLRASTQRSYSAALRTRTGRSQAKDNVSSYYVRVTPEIILRIRDWLTALRLNHYLDLDDSGLLGDPLRNGVLLCELITVLENVRISQLNFYPKNISEAKENLEKAVRVLNERAPELGAGSFIQVEKFLRGDHEVIWGALWIMLRYYPFANSQTAMDVGLELPYGMADLKRLETNILIWLHGLGVTEMAQCPTDINQVLHQIKTGTLLAALVSNIFPVHIAGIFRQPRTANTCISNVRKCLEILRKSSRMSQKFVWREKEIVNGDVASIIGLLEDLHRYADGMPARKRGPGYHNDGPYIGRHDVNATMNTPIAKNPREYNQTFSKTPLGQTLNRSPNHRSTFDKPPMPTNQSFQNQRTPTLESQQLYRQSREQGKQLFFERSESPMNHYSSANMSQSDICPTPVANTTKALMLRSGDLNFQQEKNLLNQDIKIRNWLETLGIRTRVDFTEDVLEDFRSGTLICDIIAAINGGKLDQVIANPKTAAQALQNIRKAIASVQKRKPLDAKYVEIDRQILRGEGAPIRDFIITLSNVYKNKTAVLQSLKSRR